MTKLFLLHVNIKESSSPEKYRPRDTKKLNLPPTTRRKSPHKSTRDKHRQNYTYNSSSMTNNSRRRENSISRTSPYSSKKKKLTEREKLPYFRDEQRERDRIKRLYGRSCSRSPSPSTRRHHISNKYRINSPTRKRRTDSRDRRHRYSPYHRSSSSRDHKSRRSRSRSKSRTPSRTGRERRKHSSRERDKEQKEPPPQIIPIVVPVPADYRFVSEIFNTALVG